MLVPETFAYEAAWHVMAEFDLYRDPHQRAAVGNRHLKFLAEGLEPFLYKEMFDARDRGDTSAQDNLTGLWESHMQTMFLLHRSTATYIVKRRIRAENEKQEPDATKLALLNRIAKSFDHIDKLERERRLRLAEETQANPVRTVFGDAGREFGSMSRPDTTKHVTAGTEQAAQLKRPKHALRFLKKFTPPEGSKPN